jgi:hypothetical protein
MEQFLESSFWRAFSIQPALQFGAVLTGILPSKDAKSKGSQKSGGDRAYAQSINRKLQTQPEGEPQRNTEERRGTPFSAADLHLMSADLRSKPETMEQFLERR